MIRDKQKLVALAFVLGLAGCTKSIPDTPALPGSAFGPEIAALRAFELGKVRLKDFLVGSTKPDSKSAGGVRTREEALPAILSESDVSLYRSAFDAQRREDWPAADKALKQVSDKLLVGHVLRARYLGTYPTSLAKLRIWMARYGDHPGADAIYKLALKKRGRSRRAIKAPWGESLRPRPVYFGATSARPRLPSPPRLSKSQRRAARGLRRRLERYIKRDQLKRARRALRSRRSEQLLGRAYFDNYRIRIARRLLQFGRFKESFQLANKAAKRSGKYVRLGHWIAGLSGWASKKYVQAATHFEAVADAEGEHLWFRSSGAYWAARSWNDAGNSEKSQRWMNLAATQYSRTFYGLIARRKLGMAPEFNWRVPVAEPKHFAVIRKSTEGRRAMALVQVARYAPAGDELIRHYYRQGEGMPESYLAIANAARLSRVAYNVASRLAARKGTKYDVSLFPVPIWKPDGGYRLDRAVVFAVMRQESAFRYRVKSRANARGLMQLLPSTAAAMAGDKLLRRGGAPKLYEPRLNIELGQRFLEYLIKRTAINGNLYFTFAAYNAGEGNLARFEVRRDPLLFIEAMHARETRIYVKLVMYNLWAYRLRLAQPTPSLEDAAAGRWPKYRSFDGNI